MVDIPAPRSPRATEGNWNVEVAVQTPAHSALGDLLSYASSVPLAPGTLVRVPLGRREDTLGHERPTTGPV